MGCWTEYCGVSRLPIYDSDEAVVIPLVLAPDSALGERGMVNPYYVVGLTMRGLYDDYGNVVFDDRSEEIFQDFQSRCVTLGHENKPTVRIPVRGDKGILHVNMEGEILPVEYFWIRAEVYDFLLSKSRMYQKGLLQGSAADFYTRMSKLPKEFHPKDAQTLSFVPPEDFLISGGIFMNDFVKTADYVGDLVKIMSWAFTTEGSPFQEEMCQMIGFLSQLTTMAIKLTPNAYGVQYPEVQDYIELHEEYLRILTKLRQDTREEE